MGKWKGIIPIVVALLIAAGGSLFLYRWLQVKTKPPEVVKVEAKAVPVAVAAVNIPWGTKLKGNMIKKMPYLSESLPTGYSSDGDKLQGRVVIATLRQNEPITEVKLAPTSVAVGGVSAIITPGKRAIAVKGDKVIGLSGFILPGNFVDVLVTWTDPRTKTEVTKTVLERIPVLATGTEIEEDDKGDTAPVDVYTLEVTPEQAEKLALAATRGTIQFALRNVTDTEAVLTRGATISGTLDSFRAPESSPTPAPKAVKKQPKVRRSPKVVRKTTTPPKPKKRFFTVEIIQGDKLSKQEFVM
ncbi:MAG: Flp pilus assembly protein CpaB [Deltaproteobacteria bacterium]|nr:MAG: Flp pilus assembly protein CpaB [Deltaproteobacteria bacterium]